MKPALVWTVISIAASQPASIVLAVVLTEQLCVALYKMYFIRGLWHWVVGILCATLHSATTMSICSYQAEPRKECRQKCVSWGMSRLSFKVQAWLKLHIYRSHIPPTFAADLAHLSPYMIFMNHKHPKKKNTKLYETCKKVVFIAFLFTVWKENKRRHFFHK